jgi:hypothetical protein
MSPTERKEKLEDAIDLLIQEYESETGLQIFTSHFWRDHNGVPSISFTVQVPK